MRPLYLCVTCGPQQGTKGLSVCQRISQACGVDSGISDDAALTCAYVVSWDWLGAPPQDTSPLGSQ